MNNGCRVSEDSAAFFAVYVTVCFDLLQLLFDGKRRGRGQEAVRMILHLKV